MNKLWEKLFTKNDQSDSAALHSAGAIIRHRSPFEGLEVYRNSEDLSQEFINKWVIPYYMRCFSGVGESSNEEFASASNEITLDIVTRLLGDFNWRPKVVGAYFAAINNYTELDELIGRSLVKSEVCYAGMGYCFALARFKTEISKKYLIAYLDYYLEQKNLQFDQTTAYLAIDYIDADYAKRFNDKLIAYMSNEPDVNLDEHKYFFNLQMVRIKQIRDL